MEFLNAQGAVLCSIALNRPAFTQSGDTLTLANPPREALALLDGDMASMRLKDSAGGVVRDQFSVGVANADYLVNTTQVREGQIVRVSNITIKHAP